MSLDLNVIEFALYVFVWAMLGGLPGFYLAYSLDRNPRHGARLGLIVGLVLGVGGLFLGLINSPVAAINAAALLWLAALVAGGVLGSRPSARGTHNARVTIRQRTTDLAYGLLLPTFIIVMVIVVFPMIWNVVLAFRPVRLRDLPDLRLFSLEDFTLDNFDRVLSARGFGETLLRTFVYTIFGTTLAIVLGLIAALVVRDQFRGRGLVRGFMLFPYVAPIISVALVWKMMLNAQYGLVNEVIDALGGRRVDFLNTPGVAFTMVILFQAWRYFPFAYLFILARIQAIPDDLYEAAKVDGAAPSQRLWHVTLPQLRAVFGTLFLLRFIWTFNKFDDVFLLTGGAAGTKLITIEVYDQLFSARNVGTAAATAVILALILFVVVSIYFRWFMAEEN
ncbi:MAG TPA: sugar ABC transporter permease [Candidatus Limnocylindrales bacterium]|nr:sugar ABC transporter permease [Candidatus Limnocylindrales bacterium]